VNLAISVNFNLYDVLAFLNRTYLEASQCICPFISVHIKISNIFVFEPCKSTACIIIRRGKAIKAEVLQRRKMTIKKHPKDNQDRKEEKRLLRGRE
jgi:hypothetical protein